MRRLSSSDRRMSAPRSPRVAVGARIAVRRRGETLPMEIFETPLPGIGVRHEFVTRSGDRLAVVTRRDGRRELVVYDQSDPDATRASVELARDESAAMVELLGGSQVTERLEDLRHQVEGLAIQWFTIQRYQGLAGRTIGDGRIRTVTGASVVAVIRGATSMPGPGPDFRFADGDVVLVMGSDHAVAAAERVLLGG
jgi:TrkA domain protein